MAFLASLSSMVGSLAPAATPAPSVITTTLPNLPAATIGCVSNQPAQSDVATALTNMGNACDSGTTIPGMNSSPGWISYSYDSAQAYACSSGGENPCSTYEIVDFTGAIAGFCQGTGGWAYISDWAKTYGYTSADYPITLASGIYCNPGAQSEG